MEYLEFLRNKVNGYSVATFIRLEFESLILEFCLLYQLLLVFF